MKTLLGKKIIFCLAGFISLIIIFSCFLSMAGETEEEFKKVEYTSQNLRDPFINPFEIIEEETGTAPAVEIDLSNFHVQGMVWNTNKPQAVINNNVVEKGDMIDGAEILEIRRDGVYVLFDGRQYILKPMIKR